MDRITSGHAREPADGMDAARAAGGEQVPHEQHDDGTGSRDQNALDVEPVGAADVEDLGRGETADEPTDNAEDDRPDQPFAAPDNQIGRDPAIAPTTIQATMPMVRSSTPDPFGSCDESGRESPRPPVPDGPLEQT
jgi:hypothetical protein